MIKTDIILPIKYNNEDVKAQICARLPVTASELSDVVLTKRSLDLTGEHASYRATVAFSVSGGREAGLLKMRKKVQEASIEVFKAPNAILSFRPVVVGAGPAGLFASLILAEAGAMPIILERGLDVEQRAKKIKLFEQLGVLDKECNVQFGEGGAGTYSDGKLKVGAPDAYKYRVLTEFIEAGAPEEIFYSTTAHLGTDKLPGIVKGIRRKIEGLGGEFIFGARLTDLKVTNGELTSVKYEKNCETVELETKAVILAVGHSARDTLEMFNLKGLPMEAKGFGIGVRIEHPREYINQIVYKDKAAEIEESASYHLVTHLKNGRSVYSFCMCPGGSVVAATSEDGCIVTNGMSEQARMGDNSNAALLVSVTPKDFPTNDALSGIALQRAIEQAAYQRSGSYKATSQRLCDFLENRPTASKGSVNPTYPVGVEFGDIGSVLPTELSNSLRMAIGDFDDWLAGYNFGDALLTSPETRTTSPVRIVRDEKHEATGFHGIFPSGEGAGYAGGIVSSAADGIRTAEKLLLKHN